MGEEHSRQKQQQCKGTEAGSLIGSRNNNRQANVSEAQHMTEGTAYDMKRWLGFRSHLGLHTVE